MRIHRDVFTLALPLLLAACGGSDTATRDEAAATELASKAAAPQVVTINAMDFSFDAPDTIGAGMTTFRLHNHGPDLHHLMLARLEEGYTMDDLLRYMQANPGQLPEWAVRIGGPNSPAPGATAEATVDLEPGNYVMYCVIPAPDGVPHIVKGMVRPLTVTAEPATEAAAPEADVVLKLTDFDFEITPALTAGRHTIRIESAGGEPHEVFIARLEPGKTAQDLLAWIESREGPPPGVPFGGVTDVYQGGVNYLTADFVPGDYALICFTPGPDGAPHFVKGMIKDIRVE